MNKGNLPSGKLPFKNSYNFCVDIHRLNAPMVIMVYCNSAAFLWQARIPFNPFFIFCNLLKLN